MGGKVPFWRIAPIEWTGILEMGTANLPQIFYRVNDGSTGTKQH